MNRSDITRLCTILFLSTGLIIVSGAKAPGYHYAQVGLALLMVIFGVFWIANAPKEKK